MFGLKSALSSDRLERAYEPSDLGLQLVVGSAIEVIYLLRANVQADDEDYETLQRAAAAMKTIATTPHALATKLQWVMDAQLPPTTGHADPTIEVDTFVDQLTALSQALEALANKNAPTLDHDEILARLRRLHAVLVSRTSVEPDEVPGLASI